MNAMPVLLQRARTVFRSGKNAKFPYFAKAALRACVPPALFRARREALLASIATRPDRDEIEARAAYCCRLDPATPAPLPPGAPRLRDQRFPWKGHVYYFDTREFLRYFPADLRWLHIPGDVTEVPPAPAIVKSRPIGADNANAVLLNLNKVRHFVFVRDRLRFEEKRPCAVFRGKVRGKPKRIALFDRHFGHPLLDMGDTSSRPVRPEWAAPKLTLADQLRFRYVLAVEGNDVASNLKWILSSNSLAVMPRPQFETWFQEGLLEPGCHYVEIRPDYEDLPEKLAWYDAHPAAAAAILQQAHAWVARFRDPARERLVALRVLDRYFRATGQR